MKHNKGPLVPNIIIIDRPKMKNKKSILEFVLEKV